MLPLIRSPSGHRLLPPTVSTPAPRPKRFQQQAQREEWEQKNQDLSPSILKGNQKDIKRANVPANELLNPLDFMTKHTPVRRASSRKDQLSGAYSASPQFELVQEPHSTKSQAGLRFGGQTREREAISDDESSVEFDVNDNTGSKDKVAGRKGNSKGPENRRDLDQGSSLDVSDTSDPLAWQQAPPMDAGVDAKRPEPLSAPALKLRREAADAVWLADKHEAEELLELRSQNLRSLPEQTYDLSFVVKMDISHNILEPAALKEDLGRMVSLRHLDVSHNGLMWLPDSIGSLGGSLETLLLSNNNLLELPDGLGRLVSLKHLDVAFNRLPGLPDSAANLKNLETALFKGNFVDYFSPCFCGMKSLKLLDLQGGNSSRIRSLPTSSEVKRSGGYDGLAELKELKLGNNLLMSLPSGLRRLKGLRRLFLQNNRIEKLPTSLGLIGNGRLVELRLKNNRLTRLPDAVCDLLALQVLDVENNRLETLPPRIGSLGARPPPAPKPPPRPPPLPTGKSGEGSEGGSCSGSHLNDGTRSSVSNVETGGSLRVLRLANNRLMILPESFTELGPSPVLELCDVRENPLQFFFSVPFHSFFKRVLKVSRKRSDVSEEDEEESDTLFAPSTSKANAQYKKHPTAVQNEWWFEDNDIPQERSVGGRREYHLQQQQRRHRGSNKRGNANIGSKGRKWKEKGQKGMDNFDEEGAPISKAALAALSDEERALRESTRYRKHTIAQLIAEQFPSATSTVDKPWEPYRYEGDDFAATEYERHPADHPDDPELVQPNRPALAPPSPSEILRRQKKNYGKNFQVTVAEGDQVTILNRQIRPGGSGGFVGSGGKSGGIGNLAGASSASVLASAAALASRHEGLPYIPGGGGWCKVVLGSDGCTIGLLPARWVRGAGVAPANAAAALTALHRRVGAED